MYDHSVREWQYLLGKDPAVGGNGVLRKSIINLSIILVTKAVIFAG